MASFDFTSLALRYAQDAEMTSPFDHAIHRSEHFLLGAQA